MPPEPAALSGAGEIDKAGELVEVRVAGQPLEAVLDQPAGGLVVAAPVRELGLEEGPLGPRESSVFDEAADQVLAPSGERREARSSDPPARPNPSNR